CHRATYARPKPYSPKASTPSPRAMATWIARPSRVDPRIPAPALSTLPAKPFMASSPRSLPPRSACRRTAPSHTTRPGLQDSPKLASHLQVDSRPPLPLRGVLGMGGRCCPVRRVEGQEAYHPV